MSVKVRVTATETVTLNRPVLQADTTVHDTGWVLGPLACPQVQVRTTVGAGPAERLFEASTAVAAAAMAAVSPDATVDVAPRWAPARAAFVSTMAVLNARPKSIVPSMITASSGSDSASSTSAAPR